MKERNKTKRAHKYFIEAHKSYFSITCIAEMSKASIKRKLIAG